MIAYLLKTASTAPDGALAHLLAGLEIPVEELRIAANHEEVIPLLRDKDPGVVFIPPVWDDLFCIKILNDIRTLGTPLETVIAGPQPLIPNMVAAFNADLSAFVETPVNEDVFKQVIHRVKARLAKKMETLHNLRRLAEYENGGTPGFFSPQVMERDQLLARAFMDILSQTGPLLSGSIRILLVTSSAAQQQRFGAFLKGIGITVVPANGMTEAMKIMGEETFPIIISDNILPDGDAVTLVNELRKRRATEMPRFIVLTASPDKATELLQPDTHIDDVIIKPGPGARIESILPPIIAGIYQVR